VAAIITPTPDPINQAIIAGPVVAVYQIGVIAVLVSIARKKRAAKHALRNAVAARPLPTPAPATVVATTPLEPALIVEWQPKFKSVDGFSRAPARQLQVPQREDTQLHPQPRVNTEAQHRVPTRGLYVDGFTPRRTA
jgi:hypothetical protein